MVTRVTNTGVTSESMGVPRVWVSGVKSRDGTVRLLGNYITFNEFIQMVCEVGEPGKGAWVPDTQCTE